MQKSLKQKIPNYLTLSRLFLMPLSLYFFNSHFHKLAFFSYVLIAFTDFLDGRLARRWNACSQSGIVLDQICDKLVGLGFFGTLSRMGICPVWFLALLLGTTLLLTTGYLVTQRHPDLSGPQLTSFWGKWSTALQYLWLGWLLVTGIWFGKSEKLAYVLHWNQVGFIFLSVLQIWVLVNYANRWWKQAPLKWRSHLTKEPS